MGRLSNRVEKKTLKAGDHIYSWRAGGVYAHHGIYVGDDKVIHFTIGMGQGIGTGTSIDVLLASSCPIGSTTPCLVCSSYQVKETNGVVCSCLSCFLAGGDLYRFEYAVSPSLAKFHRGTCSPATTDPNEVVIRRANDSVSTGLGCYDVINNNCENFATYCKTGRGRPSGQVAFAISTAATIIFGLVVVLPVCWVVNLVRNSLEGEAEEE